MPDKQKNLIGLDNIERSPESEQSLNESFSIAFSTATGLKVLEYLRGITIETVGGPSINKDHLMHLEGQRYVVGLIQRRINKGKSQKIIKDNTK
jgi:hypothetical protein|tara:strand:+ start:363 stop:644 length:282 start_codon:yes stop_codon:yes gene_type:complete